jgi:hypothetical protein
MACVDEARFKTSTNALNHGFTRDSRPLLKRQQINVKNVVAHAYYAIG